MKIDSYRTEHVDDIPEVKDFKPGVIYVSNQWKFCNFLCPCGCGDDVPTPFAEQADKEKHAWGFKEVDGKVTLSPSIQKLFGCKSHFFIVNSRTQWA